MVQIATIAESMPGSLKLCYGESDLPTPKFICDAAAKSMAAGRTYYTANNGTPELRETIARYATRLHGGPITRVHDRYDPVATSYSPPSGLTSGRIQISREFTMFVIRVSLP